MRKMRSSSLTIRNHSGDGLGQLVEVSLEGEIVDAAGDDFARLVEDLKAEREVVEDGFSGHLAGLGFLVEDAPDGVSMRRGDGLSQARAAPLRVVLRVQLRRLISSSTSSSTSSALGLVG